MNKFKNKKTIIDGIKFDSQREAKRYCELKLMLRAGIISNLEMQKEFILIPAQYERLTNEELLNPKNKKTKGKCIEKALKYKADFTYLENGNLAVEDVKGFKTKDYIIKRKLMLYFHNIKIKEI